MATITADLVKQLRDKTGAGMMECKAALQEAQGNLDEAATILRKRGLAQAAKKSGRSTGEGLIGSYIHLGGKIGAWDYKSLEPFCLSWLAKDARLYDAFKTGGGSALRVLSCMLLHWRNI